MSAGGKGETHLVCVEIILGDCRKSENPAQPRVACYMTIVEVDRLNRNRNWNCWWCVYFQWAAAPVFPCKSMALGTLFVSMMTLVNPFKAITDLQSLSITHSHGSVRV